MTNSKINALDLSRSLIKCNSVTPKDDGTQKILEETLKDFIGDKIQVDRKDSDCRFMDSYDHLMTLLVNQTESDIETEIQSPVRIDKEKQEGQISNNWYKD